MGCTAREKAIRNKRRLRTNHPPATSMGSGENLGHDRRNAMLADNASKPIGMFEGLSGDEKAKEKELGCEEGDESDWGYCTEEQLEDIMLKSLEFFYNEAVCKIASEGYSGEEALRAVLRSGHLYGGGDLLSDIVENAIPYLNNDVVSSPTGADNVFRDLKQLQEYALKRMVCLVQRHRPKLTKGEAIWCLLMSDLHLGKACTFEIPSSVDERTTIRSNGNGPSPSTVISVSSPIRASCSASNFMPMGSFSEPCKTCAAKKRTSFLNTTQDGRSVVGVSSATHNAFTFDVGTLQEPSTSMTQFMPNACVPSSTKSSPMGRNAVSNRKPATILPARIANDRKSKSDTSSQSDGGNGKGWVSTTCSPGKEQSQSRNSSEKKQVEQEMNSQMENVADVNSDVAPAIELSLGLASPVDSGQDQYRGKPTNAPDIVGAILGSLEQMGITDKSGNAQRNEIMLKLMHQIKDLEIQLKERSEWAQQKAMQAARKLSKDLAELNELRMERDETFRLKKDRQALEDTTMKRLTEMENALRKASGQVDRANTTVRRLETENAELRAEMEASKLSAAESVAIRQEIEKREKKCVRRAQALEKQDSKLKDEINDVKQKSVQAQQELCLIRDIQQELEVKWKQEEKAKEIAIAQAEDETRAKEAAEASARRREETLHRKTEMDFQRFKDDIERLEQELARLKATTESCKTKTNTVPNVPHMSDVDASAKSLKEANVRLLSKLQELQESSRREGNHDRRCFMCRSVEASVVFLPCAHQVVCGKCIDMHENKGLKDCPFCRSPIEERIHVYGVSK